VQEAHRKLRTNLFRWLVTERPQNLITGPLIYGMILPLLMLDACVSFYQWSCFPSMASPRCAGPTTSSSTDATSAISTSSKSFTAPIASTATGHDLHGRDTGPHGTVLLPDKTCPQDPGVHSRYKRSWNTVKPTPMRPKLEE